MQHTVVIGGLRGCTRDQVDDKCRELGLPLTGTRREKEIRVAAAVLAGCGRRRARIFETPAVKEVWAQGSFYDLVGLACSRKASDLRKEIAESINGSDRDFGNERLRYTWLPSGSLGKSVSGIRESIVSPKNTGDEIAHRRAQKVAGIKIVVFDSIYSRILESAYGAPHDNGVLFVIHDPVRNRWGYLEIGGRLLQAPENLRDPDVVRVLHATQKTTRS